MSLRVVSRDGLFKPLGESSPVVPEVSAYQEPARPEIGLDDLSEPEMLALMQMSDQQRHQAIFHDTREMFIGSPLTRATCVALRERGLAYLPAGKNFHCLTDKGRPVAALAADHLVAKHNVHAGYMLGRVATGVTLKCTCGWGCAIRAGDHMTLKASNAISSHLRTLQRVQGLATALVPQRMGDGG